MYRIRIDSAMACQKQLTKCHILCWPKHRLNVLFSSSSSSFKVFLLGLSVAYQNSKSNWNLNCPIKITPHRIFPKTKRKRIYFIGNRNVSPTLVRMLTIQLSNCICSTDYVYILMPDIFLHFSISNTIAKRGCKTFIFAEFRKAMK